jgi:hypothetical protein
MEDQSAISSAEIDAYFAILKQDDGGRAFLRIMRGFEPTTAKQKFYRSSHTASGPAFPHRRPVTGNRECGREAGSTLRKAPPRGPHARPYPFDLLAEHLNCLTVAGTR